jgi:hypothetical protein
MTRIVLLFLLSLLLCRQAVVQSFEPTRVHVNGADLHYIEQGRGEPLILLHGGKAITAHGGLRWRRSHDVTASSQARMCTPRGHVGGGVDGAGISRHTP